MKKIIVAAITALIAFGSIAYAGNNVHKKASCCTGGTCCASGNTCCSTK